MDDQRTNREGGGLRFSLRQLLIVFTIAALFFTGFMWFANNAKTVAPKEAADAFRRHQTAQK